MLRVALHKLRQTHLLCCSLHMHQNLSALTANKMCKCGLTGHHKLAWTMYLCVSQMCGLSTQLCTVSILTLDHNIQFSCAHVLNWQWLVHLFTTQPLASDICAARQCKVCTS